MFALDALLNVGSKLIDKLIPDPEQKAKAQLELQRMAQEGELAKMANETKKILDKNFKMLNNIKVKNLNNFTFECFINS